MKGKTESFDDARGWSSHVLLSFKIWVFVRDNASYVRSMILICDFFILYGPVQLQKETNG